jgi:hypothetical protein
VRELCCNARWATVGGRSQVYVVIKQMVYSMYFVRAVSCATGGVQCYVLRSRCLFMCAVGV